MASLAGGQGVRQQEDGEALVEGSQGYSKNQPEQLGTNVRLHERGSGVLRICIGCSIDHVSSFFT